MPTPVEDDFAAELAAIRRSFIRSLEARIVRLGELLPASTGGSATSGARVEVQAIAHALAGACESFGFETIGAAAMRLEDQLIQAKGAEAVNLAQEIEDLIGLCRCATLEF